MVTTIRFSDGISERQIERQGPSMPRTRRDFLTQTSLGLLGAAIAPQVAADAQTPAAPQTQTPGAPTVFGTAPPVGPPVSPDTFVQAGKLMQIEMTPA